MASAADSSTLEDLARLVDKMIEVAASVPTPPTVSALNNTQSEVKQLRAEVRRGEEGVSVDTPAFDNKVERESSVCLTQD